MQPFNKPYCSIKKPSGILETPASDGLCWDPDLRKTGSDPGKLLRDKSQCN